MMGCMILAFYNKLGFNQFLHSLNAKPASLLLSGTEERGGYGTLRTGTELQRDTAMERYCFGSSDRNK